MGGSTDFARELRQLGLRVKPEQWALTETYAAILKKWQRSINLTAVCNKEELYTLHFFEAFWAAENFLAPGSTVADIGSGAGFPGMAIKLFRPETEVTLIEKNLKKTMFLKNLARDLGLSPKVYSGPAESFPEWEAIDIATCRALRPSKELLTALEWSNVSFLHFRGREKDGLLNSWKLGRELRYPLSENRWVSLYLPDVSRGTPLNR